MAGATGPAQTAVEGQGALSAHVCPECLGRFPLAHPRQLFCCPRHQQAWKARNRSRGLQLLPFAWTARQTRGGSRGDVDTGRQALADGDVLMGRWRDEDAAERRMGMVDYLALRYRLGYDRP